MRGIKRMMRVLFAGFFSVIVFVLEMVAKVYSLVISWFYIVLAICAIVALSMKQWTSLSVLIGVFIISIGVIVCVGVVIGFLEIIKERLV